MSASAIRISTKKISEISGSALRIYIYLESALHGQWRVPIVLVISLVDTASRGLIPVWLIDDFYSFEARQSHHASSRSSIQSGICPCGANWPGNNWCFRQIKYYAHVSTLIEVCELGAGTGLPGIYAFTKGATRVVLTDYPDENILDCLWDNVRRNIPEENVFMSDTSVDERWCTVQGYDWGTTTDDLTKWHRRVQSLIW
jgi:hypothetical protein